MTNEKTQILDQLGFADKNKTGRYGRKVDATWFYYDERTNTFEKNFLGRTKRLLDCKGHDIEFCFEVIKWQESSYKILKNIVNVTEHYKLALQEKIYKSESHYPFYFFLIPNAGNVFLLKMIELKVVELVSKTITEIEKRKVTRVKTMKNFVGLTEKGKEMINIYESIKFLKAR